MKALSVLLLLVGLCTGPLARGASEVELLTDGDELTPSTTLELRFAREMVKAEEVGLGATPPPLVVQPALAGTFTWLSKRSGVFTPTEEPAMGATYTLSLRAGLKDAAGKAVTAKLQTKLKTPPFGLVGGLAGKAAALGSPTPAEQWVFNREVNLEGATPLFRFVDPKGQAVGATVRYAKGDDYYDANADWEPWELRWDATHRAQKPRRRVDDQGQAIKPEPTRNRLIIEPLEPLAAGVVWRLEMKPGLRAVRGQYTIQRKETSQLGLLEPFAITKLTTSSYLNSGRSAELTFTRSASEALQDDTAAQFFKITPEVENLHFTKGYEGVTINGYFQRGVDYRLEISPELRDEAGVPLGGERVRTLRFGEVKPRVYLPVIQGHQMAAGQRKFPVACVNMKSLRVTAQLVAPGKAAAALWSFQNYERRGNDREDNERFERLAPADIGGTKIFDRTTVLPNPRLDQRQELLLDWTELLAGAPTGAILLTVDGLPMGSQKAPRAGAQALVQLTDLGVFWKKVGDELRVSVFSMATGLPVGDAEVALFMEPVDPDPKAHAKPPVPAGGARANKEGVATIPVVADLAWLTVKHGDDTHTMRIGPSATELPMVAFRLPIQYDSWEPQGPKGDVLRALLFTERPLYKPGETAHLKGLVRALGQAGLRFVAGTKGTLTVTRPHEGGSDEIAVTTDEHGAFHADLPLDASLVGGYSVSLKMGDNEQNNEGFSTTFLTADYQPNAFDVTVALPKRLAPGAEVAAAASGRYFFGAPLGKAHAKWTLQYTDESFSAEGFPDFNFQDDTGPQMKSLTLRGEGDLAARGTLDIRPRLPEPDGVPKHGAMTVEVTDENQQTVSHQQEFTRDASSFYLGMKTTEGYLIGHTESIGALAIALRPDGTPVPKPVAVKAELIRISYETVRAQGAGGAQTYHTEKREEVVQSVGGKTLVPERAGAEWALPPGETARFKPGHGGDYLLRISAQDEGGRRVSTEHRFAVSGTEPVAWDYRNPAQVELVADKADYHPGETARLLIKTPIAGEAMVNVERDNQVLRSLRVTLKGNAPMLEIPLVNGDGPNVFVSMILIRGAAQSTHKLQTPEYRYGICRLHVSEPETALAVKITPRAPKVEPGQEIVTEVAVLEANGQPAAGAEVTFFAVDDGVLALTGYARPQPRDVFEMPFALKVRTGLSLFELIPEVDPAPDAIAAGPDLMNKGYLIGGGGPGGPGIQLRSDFPGTAIWEPALKTDAQGKVIVKFKAPDALTSYRLVAVASAGTNRFGSAESNVQISKRLILLSALGQFAHAGDNLTARAVVRNESPAAGTAIVKLEVDATAEAPAKPLEMSVALKAGEAQSVDFPVKLKKPGTAVWKWTAHMSAPDGQLEDGLVASFKVISPAPILRETYLPELSAAQSDLLNGVNPQLLEGIGQVQVTLSNTRLASLRESSQALLEYPYGCAEQTVSSMIPWIVAHDFGTILPALADAKTSQAALAHGLEKLNAMATEEGGLAYWPGGRYTDLTVSAYATLALSLMVKHGDDEPALLEHLTKFLSESLRWVGDRNSRVSLDDLALALYALASAGKAEPAYHETLFQRRTQLTAEGRAFLACAMMEREKYASATIEKLLDPKAASPECVCWWGSPTRERAIRLLAWTKFKPKDKETTRLTQEILAARVHGAWRTTQENAWSLLALSQYFAAVEGQVKPVFGLVHGEYTRGQRRYTFHLDQRTLTSQEVLEFDPAQTFKTLTVTNEEKGALYGDVKFTVEPPVALQPRQNRGYGVSRSYYKIGGDGALEEAKDLLVGDRVVVVLRLENQAPGHFVAIDDPLPAILEAVNPEFKSQQVGGEDAGAQDWNSDYREMRAERVLYFCDHLPAGTHTFRYLARVRSAGRVMAPSTKAEEMYRPERFGLGEGSTLESKAR